MLAGMDAGTVTMQVTFWVIWGMLPLVGLLAALTPYLMPKRECFAVTVPDAAQTDPQLRTFKRRYLLWMLGVTLGVAAIALLVMVWGTEGAFMAVYTLGVLGLIIASYTMMLHFRAKVRAYKKQQGWVSEHDQAIGFVGTEDIPHALSLKWCWIYVGLTVLVLILGLVGYPTMPAMVPMHMDISGTITDYQPKSIWLALFPVIFCVFLAIIFTFTQWTILRSKKGNDPAMPATSAWAYGMFARAQSILLVFMGSLLIGGVGLLMELAMIGVITLSQVLIPVLLMAFVAIIASVAVSLVYGQNGSRLIAKMGAGNPEEMLRDNDKYWKFGIFYVNPDDASMFLPKRFGIGWTVNFARPGIWAIIGVFVVVIAAFVTFCLMVG